MDRRKRMESLRAELSRLEGTFQAHNDVPGHPDFCVQQSIQIKVWDCLLGSPESPANVWVDWTASLDRPKVLKALRMAVKRMEYDSKLDEFFRLREVIPTDSAEHEPPNGTAGDTASQVQAREEGGTPNENSVVERRKEARDRP